MSMEDTNPGPQAPTDPLSTSSSLERRPSADDESAAMTIEFLRARLLSERSVSKAARQRAQQLTKKISELEERLEAEIQLREKLEADRVEILSKYRAELSEEYEEFFASSSGEGIARNETQMPHDDEEGPSSTRAEHLDRTDSSRQLNQEDENDEDEEPDHSGREKGVLSWGRQKALKREFGHGIDWLGRSLSQRSLPSTDGESPPQKKWAGKSVRQVRKRETSSNFEEESGQPQAPEDFSGKPGQPDDMKERLQREDERDTEVERVLERQAELIEQFEAEENAQRAWEAKFKEAKALASYETGIKPSNSSGTLETLKDGTTNLTETESVIDDGSTRHSRKVHPEHFPNSLEAIQGGQVQSKTFQRAVPEYESGIEREKNKILPTANAEKESRFSPTQKKFGSTSSGEHVSEEGESGVFESTTKGESPNKRITEVNLPDEDAELNGVESSCSVPKENLSQDEVLSNMETEQNVDKSKTPAMEVGKGSKYKKHLSSSFRFTVFPEAEPVTSTSPQGFAVYKQEMSTLEEREAGKEVLLSGSMAASEQVSGFGNLEPCADQPGATTASLDHHLSVDHQLVSEDSSRLSTKDAESQGNPKSMLLEGTREREDTAAENGATDHVPNYDDAFTDFDREEILKRRTLGSDGGQDLRRWQPDLPSYPGSRGPGAGLQPGFGRPYLDFPFHLQSSMQQLHVASKVSDGAHFSNFNSLPGKTSGVTGPVLGASAYEDTALSIQHRSVDGSLGRVEDVLRALQIAKYQLESSGEQTTPFAIDTPYGNGYDGRGAYYAEPPPPPPPPPPRLPSMYAPAPQYISPVPYSSRGAPPVSQNMQGWSVVQAGYGAGSSRQLANSPYPHYASRLVEPQSFWPPPPPHNSNPYHYDTRQYR